MSLARILPLPAVALLLAAVAGPAPAVDHAPFNARVGTQTFDPDYQFESPAKNKLVETMDQIELLGTSVAKFEMSDRVASTYGVSLSGINNLTDLFNSPSFQHAFSRRMNTYHVWVFPFTNASLANHWRNGYDGFNDYPYTSGSPNTEAKRDYEEIYNLVVAMRNDVDLAGKTIMLGHWEGDNALRNSSQDPNFNPGTTAIDSMKLWLRNRQRAIDDAKAATASSSVAVYHYAEVNLVLQTQWNPAYITVLRNVLSDSNVKVDLISYSCYDVSTVAAAVSDGDVLNFLNWSLNEINTQAADNLTGNFPAARDVYIGEIGAPLTTLNETQRVTRMRLIHQAALSWGTPYILYWQMYDNEGPTLGYWLIDNTNQKDDLYFEMQDYLGKANALKNLYRYWLDRNPTETEMNTFGGSYSTFSYSTALNTLLNSGAYTSAVSNAQYADLLALKIYGSTTHPMRATLLSQLGSQSRSAVLDNALNNAAFQAVLPNQDFAEYLHEKTWGVAAPNSVDVAATVTQLQSTPRATVWRQFLNAPRFAAAELEMLDINAIDAPQVEQKHFFIGLVTSVENWHIY